MKNSFLSQYDSFYFIGICGVSMSALAQYMLTLKKRVGGCDASCGETGALLKRFGARINEDGDGVENYDCIVYTDAVRADDRQLKAARTLGKKVYPRGRFLREVCAGFKRVIAVAGCHGKTTCTAMIASVFLAAGRKFAAHIGGFAADMGNFYMCGDDYFITEACEYKKNFLCLKPDVAVVLSTDPDHLECYSGKGELKEAYKKFASSAAACYCREGEDVPSSATFGTGGADFSAQDIVCRNGRYSFNAFAYGKLLGEISLGVIGRHNVENAMAAIAVCCGEGIAFSEIKRGLESFRGVERRMEILGETGGAEVIADYAHHPAEIKCALKAVKKITEGELYVVFQPHTYSRTKNLFPQFVAVLSGVKKLMVYKTFAAREYYDDAGSALTLAQSIKKCRYGENLCDISAFIKGAGKGDTVLFLGAGDIYFIAKDLVKNSE